MVQHSAREHATWSASSSARNFACPGALALIQAMNLTDREGQAAAWGTACHQVAELCFTEGSEAAAHIGRVVKTKEHTFVFDDEQAECTQVFLDYVRGRMEEYARDYVHNAATLLIEQQFSLEALDPPFDAGGTGDAVMLFPAWGLIEVVDLKTGRNWVDAVGNPQCRTYALGAALANPGPWTQVRSTIVGPRMGGEPVRSETIDVVDLMDWTTDLKAAMDLCGRAIEAKDALRPELWAREWLTPGDHCHDTYCPAARSCPALEAKALAAAHTMFKPIDDAAVAREIMPPPDPKTLPVDKIAAILDAADMIEGWINQVRAYARELVEAGTKVGDYILVDKQARRQWKDEATLAADLKRLMHLEPAAVYTEPKLKSPAQIDQLVGKSGAEKIKGLWEKKSSGTNLVRRDKTDRPEAIPANKKFFQPITEG